MLLTEREKQVLYLIAYEFSNKEIAKILSISENTVSSYRRRLLLKFNTKNSAGLVRRSFEERILPLSMEVQKGGRVALLQFIGDNQ